MNAPTTSPPSYTLDELATAAGLSRRTVRYYIQIGLLGRAEGETRAARYGVRHLEQLVAIRRWTEEGVSLERIRDLLSRPAAASPLEPSRAPGSVEVWSHIHVVDGLEITIEPTRVSLSPEQVRRFTQMVAQAYEAVRKEDK